MYILFIILFVISSISMMILVLMQSGRAAGLSGALGGGGGMESSLFGANTATVIMKATIVMATIFMISCIAIAFMQQRSGRLSKYELTDADIYDSAAPALDSGVSDPGTSSGMGPAVTPEDETTPVDSTEPSEGTTPVEDEDTTGGTIESPDSNGAVDEGEPVTEEISVTDNATSTEDEAEGGTDSE